MLTHKRGEGPASSKTGPFTLRQTRPWQVISRSRETSTSGSILCQALTRLAPRVVLAVGMPVATQTVNWGSGGTG